VSVSSWYVSLPGTFIIEEGDQKTKQKVLCGPISPAGRCAILRLIAPAGCANSRPWLTALSAASLPRRPTSMINLKTDKTRK
jgi:hypothetical protein